MAPSKTSALETEVSELKTLVGNLLNKVNKLTTENTSLSEEIRHLKKLKGQPKIRPNKKNPEDGKNNEDGKPASAYDNTSPPKSKRPRSQERGQTAKPSPSNVRDEICSAEGVQDSWKRKGYQNFTHVDVNLEFTTTRYRREVWLTPEGQTVIAPLPAHVKGRFGDNLTAMVLDLYHSCSVTQPLLLDWLHSHGCPISEGKLNDLLIHGHEPFHQEREEILEAGIACSRALLVDDTGARHDGKNGYCTVIGNETFTVFASTASKSRIISHSLCWFHASRPLAKLIPANKQERAARDWMEKQFWYLYDDVEAYCQAPTEAKKNQIEQDFDYWVTTQVDYSDLRNVLGKLHRAREELLLILKHPWLPLHNNLSERQIREYVKRSKISGGTRSALGRKCRDTFASLKKTCKLHGVSFSRYLKDRISGGRMIPRLSDMIRNKSTQLMGSHV